VRSIEERDAEAIARTFSASRAQAATLGAARESKRPRQRNGVTGKDRES
jgi:hypothetical protein